MLFQEMSTLSHFLKEKMFYVCAGEKKLILWVLFKMK